jgi:hypothetical protein
VHCGSRRVVGIEYGFDRPVAYEFAIDAGDDPATRHIGQHLVFELGWVGSTLADEITIKPLLRDTLELAKQMELRVLPWITPSVQNKV